MEPTIRVGEVVYSSAGRLPTVGDVIVLPKEEIFVVHRFVFDFAPLFPSWGLERGDAESCARIFNKRDVAGVITFPDLSRAPSLPWTAFELLRWLQVMVRRCCRRVFFMTT